MADSTPNTVFRNSNPLAFDLYNDDNQQVLYIQDDGSAQRMFLEIHNTSQWEINIPTSGGAAANGDYHFSLRFRHGTLRAESQTKFAGMFMNETAMAAQEVTLNISTPLIQNDTVSFNINNVGKNSLKLAPGARLKLALDGLAADGRGGARNTRFEVSYQKLNYTGDSAPISGGRIHHLSIVNHQGQKNIPLHVSVIGSNTILNDGKTPNLQELRITNVGDDSIALATQGDSASKFILTFDVFNASENNDWALGDSGAVGNIVPQVVTGKKDTNGSPVKDENWGITRQNVGDSPEWIIQPVKKTSLAAGQSFLLELANIISSMPSGLTNVYVRYQNIPGYWDGQFIVSLEKTQLVQRDQFQGDAYSQVSFIGIGTAKPTAPLEVNGLGKFTQLGVNGAANIAGQFEVSGPATLSQLDVKGPLSVTGNVGLGTGVPSSNKLAIRHQLGSDDIGQFQHNLQLEISSGLGQAGSRSMGIGLLDNGKGVLQVKEANVGYNDLLLNPVRGNVGVGTVSPSQRLTIESPDAGTYLNVRAPGFEVLLGADASGGIVSTMTNHDLQLRAGGNQTRLTIKAGGEVCVGPLGPMGQLTIDTGGGGKNSIWCEHHGSNFIVRPLSPGSNVTVLENSAGGGLYLNTFITTPNRIVIGDYVIESRPENAWGQQTSGLYITKGGKTIVRFGDIQDMMQIHLSSDQGKYFYCNDQGNTGWN